MSDGEERKDELDNGEQPSTEGRPSEGEAPAAETQAETQAGSDADAPADAAAADAEGAADGAAAPEEAAASDADEPARREAERVQGKAPARAASKPSSGGGSRAVMLLALGLVVGALGGWAAREARAHTLLRGDSGDAGGSCAAWENRICESLGAEAFTCLEAKAAAGLLPAAACDEALDAVPDTLEKAKEARKVCDDLVTKLCADLGNETQTCQMVREKSQSFPPDRCQEMLDNYEQVAGQLRMMEQAQRSRMPGMGPHGASPHGASPHGASPHGASPQAKPPAAPPSGPAAPATPGTATPGTATPGTASSPAPSH